MNRIKYFICVAVLVVLAVQVSAQSSIEDVLIQIRENNAELKARRNMRDAQTLDARSSTNLEDPTAEFIHAWGRPASNGKTGELTITQEIDFPTVYPNLSKAAKARERQYGSEYDAFEKQLLLEAELTCINILSLRIRNIYMAKAVDNAKSILELVQKRASAGDASALEINQARFELISAGNELASVEVELESAQNRIKNLNGGIPIVFNPVFDLYDVPLEPFDIVWQRYESSPELLAYLAQAEAAAYDVKAAKGRSLPKLALGYRHEYAPGEKFNGVVVGVSIPLFSNRNQVKKAKAETLTAQAEYQSSRIDAKMALQALYSQAVVLKNAVDEYSALLKPDGAMEILLTAYESGHISLADYYSQLKPVYESIMATIQTTLDYYAVRASINMINL